MTTSAPTTILRTVDKPRLQVIGEPIPTPRRPPNEQLRPREFLTAQEEPAIFALSRACIARGIGSSNPSPSSGESGANLSLAGIRLPTSRSRGFPRVCAARLAARSAETRRVEQYRTKERQYLCRPLFQYRRAAGAVSGPWRGWLAGKRVGRGVPISVGR